MLRRGTRTGGAPHGSAATGSRRAPRLLLHPGFLVPVALVVGSALTGRGNTLVLAGLVVVVTAARLATGGGFDRWVERGFAALGRGLGAAIFALIFAVAFIPAHLLGRRHWARDRAVPPTWTVRRPPPIGSERHLSAGADDQVKGAPHLLLRSVGLVAVILIANYAIGAAWDGLSPRSEAPLGTASPTLINVSGSEAPRDPRIDDPAMGAAPWAAQYFEELNAIRVSYWPFVLFRNEAYRGKYVNGEGWTRRSYEAPATRSARRPLLAFYGGSTMFGIGQRDAHTIPSAVARLAAAEGYPVEVANHGMSGFVSWQEMMLFEHFTAEGERPLRAVFYDGTNDVNAQRQPAVAGSPANTEVDDVGSRIATAPTVSGEVPPAASAPSDDRGWWDLYQEHSAVQRLVDTVRDELDGDPAGASPAQADDRTPEEVGASTIEVYERSRALIEDIGRRGDVTPAFFWQPVPGWDDANAPYAAAVKRLSEPTTPLVRCLDDHQEVYLADSHTNEQGAQLVAACLWKHLGPVVREWYADEAIPRQELHPEAVDTDDVLSATPKVRLDRVAPVLDAGWAESNTIPNVVTDCLTRSAGTRVTTQTGPTFARNADGEIGRLTTSVITFPTDDAAEDAAAALETGAGQDCLAQAAVDTLSVRGEVRWRDATEVPSGSSGVHRWRAPVRVDSIGRDTELYLAAVRDGPKIITVEVIGTAPDNTVETGDRVIDALAG